MGRESYILERWSDHRITVTDELQGIPSIFSGYPYSAGLVLLAELYIASTSFFLLKLQPKEFNISKKLDCHQISEQQSELLCNNAAYVVDRGLKFKKIREKP